MVKIESPKIVVYHLNGIAYHYICLYEGETKTELRRHIVIDDEGEVRITRLSRNWKPLAEISNVQYEDYSWRCTNFSCGRKFRCEHFSFPGNFDKK